MSGLFETYSSPHYVILNELANTIDKTFSNGVSDYDEITFRVPLRYNLGNVAIVDIETSGFVPYRGGLVTFGAIKGNEIIITQRLKSGGGYHKVFRQKYIDIVNRWNEEDSIDLYAYNSSFESKWLECRFYELMKTKRKKDESVEFSDFHFGDASKDMTRWWRSAKRGDYSSHGKIILHNCNCLIKELSLFLIYRDSIDGGIVVE